MWGDLQSQGIPINNNIFIYGGYKIYGNSDTAIKSLIYTEWTKGTGNATAEQQRQALVAEAQYWVDQKIRYYSTYYPGRENAPKLDRNNPPEFLDCSDFTARVYSTVFDINIGTVTYDQVLRGTPVQYDDLKPGDLVFFSWSNNGVADHVGIYMGSGQFSHEAGSNSNPRTTATSDLGVYYLDYFLTARRIIQDDGSIVNN